jgi:hypothetical protein
MYRSFQRFLLDRRNGWAKRQLMHIKKYHIVFLLLLTLAFSMPSAAYGVQAEESRLKAVFVLNFAKLTEWPADTKVDSGTLTISILGLAPNATFVNALNGQIIHGATIKVKFSDNVREAKNSQILYIYGSEPPRLTEIMKEASQYHLLTISDIPRFCEAGGMIGMVPADKRLGFDVNYAAVSKAGLSVSSQLLKLARTIIK